MMKSWIYLAGAIFTEIAGTITMKYSNGLTRIIPSIMVFVLYAISTGLLTIAIKEIDLSIAYSVWSGVGIAFTVVAGYFWFHESFSVQKFIFISMILIGVIGLYLFDPAKSVRID